MNDRIHPGFGFLEKASLVLLALQAAYLALTFARSGLAETPNALLALFAGTILFVTMNRRWAAGSRSQGAAPWLVATRGSVLLILTIATVAALFYRFLPLDSLERATPQVMLSLVWVLLALKGAALGKLKPGGPIGLRVHWTLTSRLAWDRAHRTMGRILFWGALTGLAVSGFVSVQATYILWVALIATGLLMALIEARQAWRTDPDRA